jgi:hypothetical protein
MGTTYGKNTMSVITSLSDLEALYGRAKPASIEKVLDHLSPLYQRWISASRFLVLSTVGPGGTDASPRGDDEAVVRVADENTLWLPDWRGNNRLDSLRNIVEDGRVSLMFMVPGSNNVIRVNGKAQLSTEPALCTKFDKNGKQPRSVIIVQVAEVYFQCAKALMRSRLWQSADEGQALPSAGEFIKEVRADFDAESYDGGYEDYARDKMW